MTQIQDLIYYKDFIDPVLKSWGQMWRNGFFQFSEVWLVTLIAYLDWLLCLGIWVKSCFLIGKKMQLRNKNDVICEWIALLRANQIANR